MKEIEILVELYTDIDICKQIFKKFNFIGTNHVIDYYYYDPLRSNLKPNQNYELNECFRLRKKDNKNYITYKVDHFNDKNVWLYSDEYETQVEDIKMLEKIIKSLGLKELIIINNKKTIYTFENYEIVLEEVENLGKFMEVEYCTGKDVDIKKVKEEIQSFIDSLDLEVSSELHMGKPEMMIRKMTNYQ